MKKDIILFLLYIGILSPFSLSASDIIQFRKTPIEDTTSLTNILAIAKTMKDTVSSAKNLHSVNSIGIKSREEIDTMLNSSGRIVNNTVPENVNLLKYIQQYDIYKSMVYPKPSKAFSQEELDSPEMNPLFMPLVLNSIHCDYKIEWQNRHEPEPKCLLESDSLDSLLTDIRSKQYIMGLINGILLSAEIKQLGTIKYDQKKLPQSENLVYRLDSNKPAILMKVVNSVYKGKPYEFELPKTELSPWTIKGYTKLQFSQTYVSPNWSAGGESNMAGLADLYMQANYSDLRNVEFDNNIEAKVGINTVSSDSLRNLNVSTNELSANSKIGIKMHNDFYYSLSGEFEAQLLNNYKTNSMTLTSAFFSPAKLFVGLGIDYKKNDDKKGYNLSVMLAPFTYKLNYLNDIKNFDVSSYGIKDGHHFGSELGSKVSVTLNWKLSDNTQWTSKFYYYTNFSYVDAEWENTLDMTLNSYFSTQIDLYPKLDDRLKRTPGEPLVQMQELLSFGLTYRWR